MTANFQNQYLLVDYLQLATRPIYKLEKTYYIWQLLYIRPFYKQQ